MRSARRDGIEFDMRRVAWLAALGAAYLLGMWSQQQRWFPAPQLAAAGRQVRWWFRPERGFNDPRGRREVACDQLRGERTLVLLTLGQSNAANEGSPGYPPQAGVYNFNFLDGRCYHAADPLLGTTGNGASVWTRVARGLIDAGVARRVVIAPIAVGGSSIERWRAGGDLHPRIARALSGLQQVSLPPTHILWHQGENDALRLSGEQYVEAFASVRAAFRDGGAQAPIYVAVASICGHPGSDAIRDAQRSLPRRFDDVLAGPDTDRLDRIRWRRDGCHFSAEGLDRHAEAWLEVLAGAEAAASQG